MKKGSKYYPLFEYLSMNQQDEISLSFAEIETLLQAQLPSLAYHTRSWWSNRDGALQAVSWKQAGYRVAVIDLEQKSIRFERPVKKVPVHWEGDVVQWNSELIKSLRRYMGLNQAEFAAELGVRQQTVSEWEKGIYSPTRATNKHLMLIAERAGYQYHTETASRNPTS